MNIIALDFGSGKIAGVLAVVDKNTGSINITARVSMPTKEISGGMVLGLRPAAAGVRAVIKELTCGERLNFKLICGLRGTYLNLQRAHGFKNIIDCDVRSITSEDVQLAMESAVPAGIREKNFSLVNVIAQHYIIDGKEGIKDPVGMSGFMLEVESLVVSAFSSHFENLSRAVNMAGFEDAVFLPTILTLCESVLTEDERELGSVLIDFGAEVTAFAFYHHGGLIMHREIPLGFNFIDRDIAYLMQNPLSAAKEIKEQYKFGDDEILDDVIMLRLHEVLQKIHGALLESSLYLKMPPIHMVLCGGGAKLDSLSEHVKNYFKIKKVRLGYCTNAVENSEEYTSACALIQYYEMHNTQEEALEEHGPKLGSFVKKILDNVF